MLIAVQEKNATDFNSALREYRGVVEKQAPDPKKLGKTSWEAWYNRTDMITICIVMYLTASLVTLKGYLYWFEDFERLDSGWQLRRLVCTRLPSRCESIYPIGPPS